MHRGLPWLVCATLTFSATALAQETNFGARGTWLPNGSLDLHIGALQRPFGQRRHPVDLRVAPGVFYFFASQWAVGVEVAFAYASGSEPVEGTRLRSLGTEVVPAIGYAWRWNERLSWMPRLSLRYGFSRTTPQDDTSALSIAAQNRHEVSAGLYAPVLWHVTRHAIFGIGPDLSWLFFSRKANDDVHFAKDATGFRVGLRSSLGFWF